MDHRCESGAKRYTNFDRRGDERPVYHSTFVVQANGNRLVVHANPEG
jgi:hypothetical protein